VRGGQREILAGQILELKIGRGIGIAHKADHGQLGGSQHWKQEARIATPRRPKGNSLRELRRRFGGVVFIARSL